MSSTFPDDAIKAHRKDHIEHDRQLELFTSNHNSFPSMRWNDMVFGSFQDTLLRQAVNGKRAGRSSDGNADTVSTTGFFSLPRELRDTIYDDVAEEAEIIVKIVLKRGHVPQVVAFALGGLKDACSQLHLEFLDAVVRRVKTLMTKGDNHGRTLFNAVTVPRARVVLMHRASQPQTTSVIEHPVRGTFLHRPRWSTDETTLQIPQSSGITVVLHPTTEDYFEDVYKREAPVSKDFQNFRLSIEFEPPGSHDDGRLMPQSEFPILLKHHDLNHLGPSDMNDNQEVPLNGITSHMKAVCDSVNWSGYDTQEILNLRIQYPHFERLQLAMQRHCSRPSTKEEEVERHNLNECTVEEMECFICSSVFACSEHDGSAECGCRRCTKPERRMYREYPLIPRPSVYTFVRYCINHFETPYHPFEGYVYESDPANE